MCKREIIEKFSTISTLEELKNIGTFEKSLDELQNIVEPLYIRAKTFEELLEVLLVLKENWLSFIDGPFVSRQQELIYYLTQLDGEDRRRALSIPDDLFKDTEEVKKWHQKIVKYVHPDKGGNNLAFQNLQEIYKILLDVSDE